MTITPTPEVTRTNGYAVTSPVFAGSDGIQAATVRELNARVRQEAGYLQDLLAEFAKILPVSAIIEEFLAKMNENLQNIQRDLKKMNAKTVSELVNCLNKLIDLVSLQNTPYKEMIDLCKFLITSANPAIKQSATSLLKKMFSFMGPALNLFLKDVSPAYFKTLQSEFNRVKVLEETEKIPKIAVIRDAAAKKEADFLENLPKVDISGEV